MKLIFNLTLIFLSLPSQASMLSITYFPGMKWNAGQIKKIFEVKYSIPSRLISLREASRCFQLDNRYLELCINDKGELSKLSNTNFINIRRSLNTFNSGAKNDF